MADVVSVRDEVLAELARAGQLVERRVQPDGDVGGWSGRDVLCHLAAYARLVGAIVRAEAEGRSATEPELYGRELTDAERAVTDVGEINVALGREYAALGYRQALAVWRATHDEVRAQAARLTDAQLAAPGPVHPPHWRRPRLAEVALTLVHHYDGHMGPGSALRRGFNARLDRMATDTTAATSERPRSADTEDMDDDRGRERTRGHGRGRPRPDGRRGRGRRPDGREHPDGAAVHQGRDAPGRADHDVEGQRVARAGHRGRGRGQ
jgi:hypothetical protein